jgi:hypothetical protein
MDALEAWSEFNVAMVGATAALAGLVIVAASVNIARIVTESSLTARLSGGIAGLVLALTASAIGLVPGITAATYGTTTIVLALLAAAFAASAARHIFGNRHPQNRLKLAKSTLGFLPAAAYLLGGVLLVAGAASAGLAAFAVGSIVAIVTALVVSWIVLVEVLR